MSDEAEHEGRTLTQGGAFLWLWALVGCPVSAAAVVLLAGAHSGVLDYVMLMVVLPAPLAIAGGIALRARRSQIALAALAATGVGIGLLLALIVVAAASGLFDG